MTDSQKWMVLAVTGISFGLLYLLTPVLMPFIVAAFLAYLGDPVVDKLEARGVGRTLGVVFVFALMVLVFGAVLFFFIPLMEGQIAHFFTQLPHYLQSINSRLIPWLDGQFGFGSRRGDRGAHRGAADGRFGSWQLTGPRAATNRAHRFDPGGPGSVSRGIGRRIGPRTPVGRPGWRHR